jgi:hypothetical protein
MVGTRRARSFTIDGEAVVYGPDGAAIIVSRRLFRV